MARRGSSYQRQAIGVYLRARGIADDEIDDTIDRVIRYLDSQRITPERFRGFSYPATRNAIETALIETGGKNGILN